MGQVKRLLHQGTLADAPALYADKRAIEHAETMHFHERNVRIEYDGSEFSALCADVAMARALWREKGAPLPRPDAPTTYLGLSDVSPIAGVTPTRFDIEECTYPSLPETTIHVHYRNLRIEFTHAEWEQFAQGVGDAHAAWSPA